jgi:hypothetical protein
MVKAGERATRGFSKKRKSRQDHNSGAKAPANRWLVDS